MYRTKTSKLRTIIPHKKKNSVTVQLKLVVPTQKKCMGSLVVEITTLNPLYASCRVFDLRKGHAFARDPMVVLSLRVFR